MKPKILIVDDLIENLISLEAILEDFDTEIFRAFSGKEALSLSLKEEFALVILDVQMPEMNGYETLELMRQRKKTKYLPVIFVSAIHQSDLHIIKGIETGAVDFIPKPIIPDILKGKVRVFLDLFLQRKRLDFLLEEMQEANENLKIAKRRAEEATRTKSMFLANMSHEIRTPLNGVLGLSKLLQRTQLNQEQEEYLNIISISGENLLHIINDILDFSKIESGQVTLEHINFELQPLVHTIFQLLKFRALENGIEFNYHIAPDVPNVLTGDPLRINQVLTNLLNNAIKFTHSGSVNLFIEKIDTHYHTHRILFRIVDTGIGISEENKRLLFREFSQTDASTARKYGGTGLGLAISNNLVALMKGEIGVESKLGEGSEFWFRLPLSEPNQSENNNISEHFQISSEIKVLLAEDNLINQKVAALSLKQLGIECDIAQNGLEAFDMYKQNKYDLILMDMRMPEVDGIQSAEMIRAYEREMIKISPSYIAAFTSSILPEDKERCYNAGMNDFLNKPFYESDLRKLIQNVIKRNEFSLNDK